MGNHPGSSPGNRTNRERFKPLFFWLSSAACRAPNLCFMAKSLPIGAVTGTVQQMEYRLVPILHPLHAIGQRYFSFLFTTFGATNRCKASPGMIRGEVQGSVFLYFGIGGAVTGTW